MKISALRQPLSALCDLSSCEVSEPQESQLVGVVHLNCWIVGLPHLWSPFLKGPGWCPRVEVELRPPHCAGVEMGEALCFPSLGHRIDLRWGMVGVQGVVEPVPWLEYLCTKPWKDWSQVQGGCHLL